MSLQIYNTLSRKKEVFKPLHPTHVGMYVCGPTVYGDPHLGHARPAITFDIVFRYLQHLGFKVRYVRNITDAGHLENDAEVGEDKIAKKARLEQLEPMEVVQYYTLRYHQAIEALNCLSPNIEPRATGHIIEQIEMVKQILENELAYETNGSVYLDVNKYNEKYPYGKLSGRNLEDTLENTRSLDGQDEKKSPVDFAIWKKAAPEHIMRWPSPWGEGFPGWHLECSAMSSKYLGDTFDIHGGGMDLVFPHHEAEIAQSNACNDCDPAKFWMHNNMITINGKKMGKSLGNAVNLEQFFTGNHDLLERAFAPMTIRFFILQAHYRSTVDFSNEALQAAEKGMAKLMNAYETLEGITVSDSSTYDLAELKDKCYAAMNDDFNTPILISHLFDGVRIINSVKDGTEQLSANDLDDLKQLFQTFVIDILGLKPNKEEAGNDLTNELMDIVLQLRSKAKENKDWDSADLIREELNKLNIQVKDGKEGSSWQLKN
ncbi:MAG: cysteine--tRNA ligase [Flavobacteriales bacterium]|nr:cysteine--tRNA ligase [Flavobacteriales bacterium]|tara:strand:+ start:2455 stop:3918 length:1464 start_codon:yes stop_codon:yes gene_type:complete